MFEKFNDTARATVVMAREVAAELQQDHISTGHMLLAIAGTAVAGASPKAEAVITTLGASSAAIRDQTAPGLEKGSSTSPGHIPFTPNLKQGLEFALRSSMMVGDNHIGPEHLLAGLTRATDSTAGRILARLGFTETGVHAAIRDSTPAPSPTAARTCDVYLPVGKSVFKNGGKIYPDLAAATAAHPGQEIAPFTVPLHDGEFFDVGTPLPGNRFKSWGSFTDYPAAFAAGEFGKSASGYDMVVKLMVPHVQELRGQDSRGHDIVLGRSVEYSRVGLMRRISEQTSHGRHRVPGRGR